MKVKTSELIGPALDWAVAKCEGEIYRAIHTTNGIGMEFPATEYSTNWLQGGPITEREGIYFRAIRSKGHSLHGTYLAAPSDSNTLATVRWIKREDFAQHYFSGPTLLIATMRCFVASRLGNEVDVPDELVSNRKRKRNGNDKRRFSTPF